MFCRVGCGQNPRAEIVGVLSINIYTTQYGFESYSGSIERTILPMSPFLFQIFTPNTDSV